MTWERFCKRRTRTLTFKSAWVCAETEKLVRSSLCVSSCHCSQALREGASKEQLSVTWQGRRW